METKTKINLLAGSTGILLIACTVLTYVHFKSPSDGVAFTSSSPAVLDKSSVIRLDTSAVGSSESDLIELTGGDITDLLNFNADMNLDNKDILEEMRKKNKHISPYDGEWVKDSYARLKHKNFTNWNGKPYNLRREILPRAYAFGKYKLDSLLSKIDSVNATPEFANRHDSLKIQGVRMYLTFTKFERRKDRHMDLMLVPVLGNGKDYPSLKPSEGTEAFVNSGLVVNTSSPCPKMCNE